MFSCSAFDHIAVKYKSNIDVIKEVNKALCDYIRRCIVDKRMDQRKSF